MKRILLCKPRLIEVICVWSCCLLLISIRAVANTPVDYVHPRYYTSMFEETIGGETIRLSDTDIRAIVDRRSIIRIVFDKEKLGEIARILGEQASRGEGPEGIFLRIEAYVNPKDAERYPVPVEKYSTVQKKTEAPRTPLPEESGASRADKVGKIIYEVYYHEKSLQLYDSETGEVIDSIVDTYLDFSSLNLREGDRVYLIISDVETQYYISKIFEVKYFGPKVYATTPMIFTSRLSNKGDTTSPSVGTTVVLKLVSRNAKWLEDWLHFGINVAFLDFDPTQTIELGLGFALTFYKDYFEIGYGYNLSMEEDAQYWYVGLNVVNLTTFFEK